MSKAKQGQERTLKVVPGLARDSDPIDDGVRVLIGSTTPRIHSKLNDLPGRGEEIIDFATSIGIDLMPWQRFAITQASKIKADGRWHSGEVTIVGARQNGKSTLLLTRALAGLFLLDEPLQIASAHRLSTSLELFRQIIKVIETNDSLKKQIKVVRWAHGSEEIETLSGNRYMIKASNSAARGISRPETVYMDELSEMKDLDGGNKVRRRTSRPSSSGSAPTPRNRSRPRPGKSCWRS